MPVSRHEYLLLIQDAIQGATKIMPTEAESRSAIEALLLTAATLGNAMSRNSIGFSEAHIEESATRMAEELEQTFGIEVLV